MQMAQGVTEKCGYIINLVDGVATVEGLVGISPGAQLAILTDSGV